MNVNDGGPAFPTFSAISHCDEGGASLRDYFAAKALASIYADAMRDLRASGYPHDWREGVASDAYKIADAMLRARGAQ